MFVDTDDQQVWLVSYYDRGSKPLLPERCITITSRNVRASATLDDTEWYIITHFCEKSATTHFPGKNKTYNFDCEHYQPFAVPEKTSFIIIRNEMPSFKEVKELCERKINIYEST